tara:strand:+ start:138 stop:401 length:264 start_codon:yes stop_codon:yes gene_type:complete
MGIESNTIYLDDFLSEGILKENDFRDKIDSIDWSLYKNQKVIIKGCTSVPVPTWSYLIIATQLALYANQILYGEPCSAVSIFKRRNK